MLVCATTAAATLPCRCPRSPLRRCGREHDEARVVLVGGLDDALPRRRHFNGLAARQESGVDGQRGAVSGGTFGGLTDLTRVVGVEVFRVGRGEAHVDGTPDAHDERISPGWQLVRGPCDRRRREV